MYKRWSIAAYVQEERWRDFVRLKENRAWSWQALIARTTEMLKTYDDGECAKFPPRKRHLISINDKRTMQEFYRQLKRTGAGESWAINQLIEEELFANGLL